ncbi:MAG: flavin reductase family protein [Dehalococcoidia bacterium]|nr:flavin reductase family protein [Dehalococcoidia bacterium]
MADDPFLQFAPEDTEVRPNAEASRLLMGGPVVLVTTTWRGTPNVMPLSWYTPLSSDPALIGISVEQSRHTAEMISHSQEFALNFPKRPYVHHVQYLGGLSGEGIDKFEATQWSTFTPTSITSPLLAGCAGWIECQVVEVTPLGDHVLFVGEVVAVRIDPASYDEDLRQWRFGEQDDRVLHFLGGNRYSSLYHAIEARLPRDFEAPERILRERVEEELELSREARERREERVEALREEVRRGNVVDVDDLELDLADDDVLDLSKGAILRPPEEPEAPERD